MLLGALNAFAAKLVSKRKTLSPDRLTLANKMSENFLKNVRVIADILSDILTESFENTDLIAIDEEKCREVEYLRYMTNLSKKFSDLGVSGTEISSVLEKLNSEDKDFDRIASEIQSVNIVGGEIVEIVETEIERSMRIRQIYTHLRFYRRTSHILDNDGYSWTLFFDSEDKEPEEDRNARNFPLSNDARRDLRFELVYYFAKGMYCHMDEIYNKNLDYLIESLSKLFYGFSEFERLSVIFEKDSNGRVNTKYASEENINLIWRFVHGCVKNTLQYCYACNIRVLKCSTVDRSGDIQEKLITIDYPGEFSRWGIETPSFFQLI